jgi:anti-sigma B factor antagonist
LSELGDISFEQRHGVPVARIAGEVDASNAPAVLGLLMKETPSDAPGLVFDLTATSYLDSSGVALLFTAAKGLTARQQELTIAVGPESFVADVLRTTRVEDAAAVHGSVDEAIEALASGSGG